MQAVILVGGEGTRLRPLTYSLPKPMAPLLGRPFIGWIIERLRTAGVDDIILSCCYMPEVIEAHFGDGRAVGVKLRYVFEEEPLGTAGAIRNALDHISGVTYACNGDILTGLDLVRLRKWHARHHAVATIHTRPVDDPSRFGVVETDADGRVARFVEKPKPGQTSARDINAGTYVLEPAAVEAIPTGRAVSIERETFPHLIEQTKRVYALSTNDYWIDVGKPDAYVQAHHDIFDGKFAQPVGDRTRERVWCADTIDLRGATIRPPVYFGRDVRLEDGATIGPYAAIYERCRIGKNARVANSILWPGCRIGDDSDVDGAILGLDVAIPTGHRLVRGSVLAQVNGRTETLVFEGLFDRL